MKQETLHVIGNEFTRGIPHPDEWWENRFKVWKKFTHASLKSQHNQNFINLMIVDKYMPLKVRLDMEFYMNAHHNTVFFNKDNEQGQTFVDKLKERIVGFEKYENILHTRLDSDDMLHWDVVDEIQQHDYQGRHALIFQKGFCFDCVNVRLRHYAMPSPPFFTVGFPIDVYSDLSKWREYLDIEGHDTVIYKMPNTILSDNKFVVLVHGSNLDTKYESNLGLNEKIIPPELYNYILQPFGITANTYKEL